MKTIVAYARVSSHLQEKEETIENQVAEVEAYTEKLGLTINEWYKDQAISGDVPFDKRPGSSRLLHDARIGKISDLLVLRDSRLARDILINIQVLRELVQELGVTVHLVAQGRVIRPGDNLTTEYIFAAVSEEEKRRMLDQLYSGIRRKAKDGYFIGGVPPFGYQLNSERRLEPAKEEILGVGMSEAEIIKLIYRLFTEEGKTTGQVADYLNSLGIPTRSTLRRNQATASTRWTPAQIYHLINNKTYKGVHIYGKTTHGRVKHPLNIERPVEPLVSTETWDKAQTLLKANKAGSRRNGKREYLLRGLIVCGHCGRKYSGTTTVKDKYTSVLYRCCHKSSLPECPSKAVVARKIEEAVWQKATEFLANPGKVLDELLASANTEERATANLEFEKIKCNQELTGKETEKARIIELYGRGLITSEDIELQLARLANEKEALEVRVKEIDLVLSRGRVAVSKFRQFEATLSEMREATKTDPPIEVKRGVLLQLIERITIFTETDGKRKIDIKWFALPSNKAEQGITLN